MTAPSVEKGQAETLLEDVPSKYGAGLPLFFLHSLHLQGFRSIEDETFTFQPGLNVIIGANNAAKSAVIDALRLVFSLGTYEKKEDFIKLGPNDIFRDGADGPETRSINFTATFYGKADSDVPGQFYELICPGESVTVEGSTDAYTVFKLMYRVDFEFNKVKNRYEYVRNELRGGPSLTNPVTHEVLDEMRSIYLEPLRDLVRDRARVGAEIERLILSHTPKGKEGERAAIPEKLRELANKLIEEITGNKHQAAAGENLAEYARPYQVGDGSLSFLPAGISESLFGTMWPIFAHGLHGVGGLPLNHNGLGMNQLIYASIVLSRRGDAEVDSHIHKFFLIEEPEAHLHPQLQDSFFHALNRITDHQLFVTSHSPTITAKTDIDKIIVMRRDATGRTAKSLHLAQVYKDRDEDKKYLHKFLDVTRSQLLFASGAIFVEGVTEAMLMQPFSELIGRSLRDHAVEVVIIDSDEGYVHFRPLFDNGEEAYCRAVFVTDGDEPADQVKADAVFFAGTDPSLDGLDIDGSTAIATGYGTFEFGLLRAAVAGGGNLYMQALLTEAMMRAAPLAVTGVWAGTAATPGEPEKTTKRRGQFARDFLDFERPSLAYRKMKQRKAGGLDPAVWYGTWHTSDNFRKAKSNFAFHLQERLSDLGVDTRDETFVVPKYIRDAIEFVTASPAEGEANRATDR